MGQQPGKGLAVASLTCSILSCVFLILHFILWYLVFPAVIGLIVGIIAAVTSVVAKKKGFLGGMATAGLVMGIIGIALNGIIFISCLSCYGAVCNTVNTVNKAANSIYDLF